LAVRFHHRLVSVHPFPNGNGRWSRLAGDLLVAQQAGPRFTWGQANLLNAGDVRRAYIDALQAGDAHDLIPLITFARS
jgi:fido (protein-threonine AMPylation protein)